MGLLSWIPGADTVLDYVPGAQDLGLGGHTAGANLGKDASGAVAQSNANAQTIYQQALAAAAAAGAYAGPEAITAQPVTTLNVNAPMVQGTPQIIAPTTTAALADAYRADVVGMTPTAYTALGANQMLNPQDYRATTAADITPATVAAVDTRVQAGQVGPAEQAGPVDVGGVRINPAATSLRREQLAAAREMIGGPSVAERQFRAAEGQVVSDQLAMAEAARGAERAGARREAMIRAGQQGIGGALSAAALAAKEEQDRKQAYFSALSGISGQDVQLATTQANLDQQHASLQAQIDTAIAQGNVSQANALKAKQAELTTSAATSTVQAGLEQQRTQANLQQVNLTQQTMIDLANADAATKMTAAWNAAWASASQNYANAINEANRYGADVKNQAEAIKTGAINASNAAYATAQNATSATNAAAVNANLQANAGRQMAQQTTNAANALDVNKTNAATGMAANVQNAANWQNASGANALNNLNAQVQTGNQNIEAQQVRNAGTTSALGTANTSANIQGQNAATVTAGQRAAEDAKARQQAATTATLTAGLSSYLNSGGKAAEGGTSTSGGSNSLVTGLNSDGSNNPYTGGTGTSSGGTFGGGGSPYTSNAGAGAFDTTTKPPAVTSDERLKTDIKDVPPGQLMELARALDAKTFRYKPGVEDSGERVHAGEMAQALERTALGKKLVGTDASGYKKVDYLSLAGLMAAAAAQSARERART